MSTKQELLNLLNQYPEPKTLNDVLTWADLDDDTFNQCGVDDDFDTNKREAIEYAWDAGFIAGLHAMHRALRSPQKVRQV